MDQHSFKLKYTNSWCSFIILLGTHGVLKNNGVGCFQVWKDPCYNMHSSSRARVKSQTKMKSLFFHDYKSWVLYPQETIFRDVDKCVSISVKQISTKVMHTSSYFSYCTPPPSFWLNSFSWSEIYFPNLFIHFLLIVSWCFCDQIKCSLIFPCQSTISPLK